ncbi:S-layer family protein [Natranaerovirga pectinivora]|uniref:S-layer family protein n=1 Tax=Natranaerovirga pectinivora TaxID=682400 RepID=A0A4R3MPY0_9FIRM|nr:phosphodiester glycosidase family protein [Natranaerovirga pectinivora]TCT16341.1 S-layer family protein [Natranaerovirga pectinivora]
MKKKYRLILCVLIICNILLTTIMVPMNIYSTKISAKSNNEIIDEKSVNIGKNVSYTWIDMKVNNKPEKIHIVEFDLQNPNLELQAVKSNGYVYGFEELSKTAKSIDKEQNRVIAGINGDFFHTNSGIPIGMFINDGELLVTPPGDWYAFGIKEDNTTIIGKSPRVNKHLITVDNSYNISHINRIPAISEALILFTDQFFTSTKTNNERDEIICKVIDGGSRSGETMILEVIEIRRGLGNSTIQEGQVVISASGKYKKALANVNIGDHLMTRIELEDEWKNVKMAVGGEGFIVRNGEIEPPKNNFSHPRSAIGVKEDGQIVMFQVDGRSLGISEGLTLEEVGRLMKDMGVINAINLDGGGSSAIVARLPGQKLTTLLNNPSDGRERRVANSLLLVDTSELGEAAHLVIRPNVARILVGSEYKFNSVAVDENYYPVEYNEKPLWIVDNENFGSITLDGKFTAGKNPGILDVWAFSEYIYGSSSVEVVADITNIKLNHSNVALSSGETINFKITATRNGQVIESTNDAFEWVVEGDIGTIDKNGVFKGTEMSNKSGRLIVRYTNPVTKQVLTTSVNITVGRDPIIIENFEGILNNRWAASGVNYNTVNITEEIRDQFVRFGNKSVKLEYDFTNKEGTSGAYIVPKDNNPIALTGSPTKIGLWVYGDGSGNWLRGQLRDGNNQVINIDFVDLQKGIDFVGWKYLEAEIPKGRPLPLRMEAPVRLMRINENSKSKGVIYVDEIRALYGNVIEDITPPEILEIYPLNNQVVESNFNQIYAYVQDLDYDKDGNKIIKNINPNNSRLYINNKLVKHNYDHVNGVITHIPETPLVNGNYSVKLILRDDNGNQSIKEWSFRVLREQNIIFDDVPQNFWAEQAILNLANKGIISGKGNNNFAPMDNITRAEVIALVVRLFELEGTENAIEFNDLKGNEWYINYLNIATSNGVVSGYQDGTFRGNNLITRQELSVMIYNALKVTDSQLIKDNDKINLADEEAVANFAKDAVDALYRANIINGYPDGSFRPINNALRAETAMIIYNILNAKQ